MTEQPFSFPASFAQKRLWFLDRFEPGTPLYNIVAAARWRGELSVDALRRAFEDVISRHEALRTTFGSEGGEPVQIVHPHLPAGLTLLDLTSLGPERDRVAARHRDLEASRGFDLERGPLSRLLLIRLEETLYEAMLVVHHIVFDGVSMGIFLRELGTAYAARRRGAAPSWPELPVQYVDYTHWQREWLQGEVLDEMVEYWRRRLAGAPAVIELPNDRPRLPVQTYVGQSRSFRLTASLVEAVETLARREGLSLFMVQLGAFLLLVRRHTGQTDLVVGTPVANRDRLEIEGLIGLFVNSLVLRGDLSGDPTVRDLLARVRASALDAYAHQDIPFEKLVEELRPARNLSHNPLYQLVFGWHDGGRPEWVLGDIESEDLPVDSGTAKFDLSFFLERTARGVQGVIEYATELFDTATVWRLHRHFEHLLASLAASPDAPISQCAYLSPAERHQLGWEWSAGAEWSPDLVSVWVVEGFEAQARLRPEHPAVEQDGTVLTYGELDRKAEELARRLVALDVGPDVPVALFLERSPFLLVAMFATLKAGGAFLPLDPSYPADRVAFMLEDSRAPVVLTQQSLLDALPTTSQAAHLALDDSQAESLNSVPVSVSGPGPARRRPRSGNLAYVIYTSGSTGKPKGTMISHGAFTAYLRTASRAYGMVSSDRVLQFCSISFDISLEEIYPCLTHGGTLVLRTDEMVSSIAVFLERCRQWGLTVLSLPTAYWHEIVDGMRERALTLPEALRLVIIAGERALPERLAEWRRQVGRRPRLVNTYGLTESTIISTVCDLGEGPPEAVASMREVPIGRAIEGSEILLLDRHLLPVPIGVVGQIHIGGALLGRGYLGRARITADRFVPHVRGGRPGARLYRTGDLARYLPSGDLEFLGRADHQVKISGYRIEPGEIEAACVAHPAIEETVVMVREIAPGDKRLIAYLLSHPDHRPTTAVLRAFLNERLPVYMLPSQLIFLAEWPLTPNGKIDRSALPEPGGERPDLEAAYVAPRGEIEEILAGVWREIFGVDRVGIHDNFFDLGGHSLLMVQVQSRLTQKLGRDVPILDLFQFPTIATLAAHWSAASSDQESATPSTAERSRDRAELQRNLRQDRFSRARRRRS